MNKKTEKILEKNLSIFEYSEKVTAKYCSLITEGKIMIPDIMKVIKTCCDLMHPKSVNNYRTDKLNHYNSVKNALINKRLMFFKIDNQIYIPKQ